MLKTLLYFCLEQHYSHRMCFSTVFPHRRCICVTNVAFQISKAKIQQKESRCERKKKGLFNIQFKKELQQNSRENMLRKPTINIIS